jgi:hypothetical protein
MENCVQITDSKTRQVKSVNPRQQISRSDVVTHEYLKMILRNWKMQDDYIN